MQFSFSNIYDQVSKLGTSELRTSNGLRVLSYAFLDGLMGQRRMLAFTVEGYTNHYLADSLGSVYTADAKTKLDITLCIVEEVDKFNILDWEQLDFGLLVAVQKASVHRRDTEVFIRTFIRCEDDLVVTNVPGSEEEEYWQYAKLIGQQFPMTLTQVPPGLSLSVHLPGGQQYSVNSEFLREDDAEAKILIKRVSDGYSPYYLGRPFETRRVESGLSIMEVVGLFDLL